MIDWLDHNVAASMSGSDTSLREPCPAQQRYEEYHNDANGARKRRHYRLWTRQKGLCEVCGEAIDMSTKFFGDPDRFKQPSVDHIIPKSISSWSHPVCLHIQLLHRHCDNNVKNNKLLLPLSTQIAYLLKHAVTVVLAAG